MHVFISIYLHISKYNLCSVCIILLVCIFSKAAHLVLVICVLFGEVSSTLTQHSVVALVLFVGLRPSGLLLVHFGMFVFLVQFTCL